MDQPYFITDNLKAPASGPGLDPIRFDIDLKRAICITGRVTDVRTGGPVPAAIHYYPFLSNENARGFPNFRAGHTDMFWTGNRYHTDADGHYRVVGLPGRGIVAVKGFDGAHLTAVGIDRVANPPEGGIGRDFELPTYNSLRPMEYNALAEVNPPDRAEAFVHDFALQTGRSMTVQLVDPQGSPLTEASVEGRYPSPYEGRVHYSGLDDQSRTVITGLDPKATRTVLFQHDGRNLGAVLIIKPGEDDRAGADGDALRPCATVTGRVVDGDGKPVRGEVESRMSYGDNNESGSVGPDFPLDAEGRFRIEGVIPGASYAFWAKVRAVDDPNPEPLRFEPFAMVEGLTAQPSQVIDVGTFNAANGKQVKGPAHPPQLKGPRADAAMRDTPISGRIVDLQGRPIAGATVRITCPRSQRRRVTTSASGWMRSDAASHPRSRTATLPPAMTTSRGRGRPTHRAVSTPRASAAGAEVVHLSIEGPTIA